MRLQIADWRLDRVQGEIVYLRRRFPERVQRIPCVPHAEFYVFSARWKAGLEQWYGALLLRRRTGGIIELIITRELSEEELAGDPKLRRIFRQRKRVFVHPSEDALRQRLYAWFYRTFTPEWTLEEVNRDDI